MEDISEPGSTDCLVDNLKAVVRKQEEPWRQASEDSECPVHKERKTKHKKETCQHRKHRRHRRKNSNNEDREEGEIVEERSPSSSSRRRKERDKHRSSGSSSKQHTRHSSKDRRRSISRERHEHRHSSRHRRDHSEERSSEKSSKHEDSRRTDDRDVAPTETDYGHFREQRHCSPYVTSSDGRRAVITGNTRNRHARDAHRRTCLTLSTFHRNAGNILVR
nr:luc7-like protein 3 [Rhipicephalus microplus]